MLLFPFTSKEIPSLMYISIHLLTNGSTNDFAHAYFAHAGLPQGQKSMNQGPGV
jgi:hypothetical protein